MVQDTKALMVQDAKALMVHDTKALMVQDTKGLMVQDTERSTFRHGHNCCLYAVPSPPTVIPVDGLYINTFVFSQLTCCRQGFSVTSRAS